MRQAALLLLLSISAAALGQVPPVKKSDDGNPIPRVEEMVKRGDWQRAVELLERSRNACASGAAGEDCRSATDFARGYAYSTAAERDPAERGAALRNAASAYRDVLSVRPDQPQALMNLALVEKELGDWTAATTHLERAAAVDPRQSSTYFALAGDVCESLNRPEEALAYFMKAAVRGDSQSASRAITLSEARIDRATADEQPALLRKLLEYADVLQSHNDLDDEIDALEAVMERSYQANEHIANDALVRWVDAEADAGALGIDTLAHLPPDWKSPAVDGLRQLVKEGKVPSSRWKGSVERRHAWAMAAKAVADRIVPHDHASAAQLYNEALDAAPRPLEYDDHPFLRSRSIVFLDAAIQLARLYQSDRQLDPNGQAFHRLESRLFGEKMAAYQTNNLAAVQRMHTILGLIYAERDEWTGGGITNATFQLEHALSTARQREEKDGMPRQLPQISDLLAGGYLKQGRSGDARREFVNAAEGYLDLDAVDNAAQSITRARRLAGPADDLRRAEALEKIVSFRKAIPTLPAAQIASTQLPSAEELKSAGVSSTFIARQQFKMLADLGHRSNEMGQSGDSTKFYLRALEAVTDQKSLSGSGDVLRLERVETTIQKEVPVTSRNTSDSGGNLKKSSHFAEGKVWDLPDSSPNAVKEVAWSPDLLLAARVARAKETKKAEGVVVTVRESKIRVEAAPHKAEEAKATADRLRKLGVTTVVTETVEADAKTKAVVIDKRTKKEIQEPPP